MRILVCGGRQYNNLKLVFETLEVLRAQDAAKGNKTVIIQGGASGADALAKRYAELRFVECITEPAQWGEHGRSAGPIRNQKMLDDHKPDLVIAFPGGRGTFDMTSRATRAGIEVRHVA